VTIVQGLADLCLFGGVCQDESTNQQEFCVCPEGYGHDFTLFHTPNCALPSFALEGFTRLFSFVWLLVLVWYVNKMRYLTGKNRVIQLARLGLMNLLTSEF
jgi:hypothetical protein